MNCIEDDDLNYLLGPYRCNDLVARLVSGSVGMV
jgi:hypothetical protein